MSLIVNILVIALVFFGGLWALNQLGEYNDMRDCLRPTAKQYCENVGLEYVRIEFLWVGNYVFLCEDEREVTPKTFRFTEAEKERCENV